MSPNAFDPLAKTVERVITTLDCTYMYTTGLEIPSTYVFELIPYHETTQDFSFSVVLYPSDQLNRRYHFLFDKMSLRGFVKRNQWDVPALDDSMIRKVFEEFRRHFRDAAIEGYKYVSHD